MLFYSLDRTRRQAYFFGRGRDKTVCAVLTVRLTPLQFKPKITAVLAACEMRCMNVRVNSFPRFVVLNAIVNNAMFLR